MGLRFLPGEPSPLANSVDRAVWEETEYVVYCSGNNLIIVDNGTDLVQTIYLPSDGHAVAINGSTGHIAVAYGKNATVFEPIKSFNDPLRWATYFDIAQDSQINCLAWGHAELLVGNARLSVWDIEGKKEIWSTDLPEPVCFAKFSPDAWNLCTFGKDDRLLKVWNRSSFDAQSLSFDVTYVLHPSPLKWAAWRYYANDDGHEHANVLYSLAQDQVLRTWAPTKYSNWGLWASISCPKEAEPCVLNRSQLPKTLELPDSDLCDLVVVLGHKLSAYTIENLGQQPEQTMLAKVTKLVDNAPMHIRHGASLDLQSDGKLYGWASPHSLELMQHVLHGALYLASIKFETLLSHQKKLPRILSLKSSFTGHTKSIQHIVRSTKGDCLFSQSRFSDENYVWSMLALDDGSTLVRKSQLDTKRGNVKFAVLDGDTVITLTEAHLTAWDSSTPLAQEITTASVDSKAECLDMFLVPTSTPGLTLVMVFGDHLQIWYFHHGKLSDRGKAHLDGLDGSIAHATAVDPVGWSPTQPLRDVLTTISTSGVAQTWACNYSEDSISEWFETSKFNVGSDPVVKVQMSSTRKLAIAQKRRLIIWDAHNKVAEMDSQLDASEEIHDLDWTATPTGECMLGVGFSHRVQIYCQQRYDYSKELDAWMPIRIINIEQYTSHAIGDSVWLADGTFVIGAGNQLFIQDARVDLTDAAMRTLLRTRNTISALGEARTIFEISTILNGPIALYHPQFVVQAIYVGRIDMIYRIFARLLHQLKFGEVESLLGFDPLDLVDPYPLAKARTEFDETAATELEGYFTKVTLPFLTRHQQVTLLGVLQSFKVVMNNTDGVDDCGIKFLIGYHMFRLHKDTQSSMNIRDFVWASISQSKAVLLAEVLKQQPITWNTYKKCGLPYWLEHDRLVELTETLAKHRFAASRDPVQASLLYLALKKKSVLVGLWRVSSGNPEQKKTLKLLNQDYSTERWKTAALKNAYALISKHRFEYAAALFLLGDSPVDACNVLLRNLNDPALAILVARVYDGDNGATLSTLADRYILPEAEESNDRWTASWLNWIIDRPAKAVEAVVFTESVPKSTDLLKQMEDPVLTELYKIIRHKHQLPAGTEISYLTRASAIYSRMGCDLIALDLQKTWKFPAPEQIQELEQSTKERVPDSTSDGVAANGSDTGPDTGPEREQTPEYSYKMPSNLKAPPPDSAMEMDMSAFGF